MGKKSKEQRFCQQPDRDQAGLICGYPLPCPHHTAVIDVSGDKPRIEIPEHAGAAAKHADRLSDVAQALDRSVETMLPDGDYEYSYSPDGRTVVIERHGTPVVVMAADVFRWLRSMTVILFRHQLKYWNRDSRCFVPVE